MDYKMMRHINDVVTQKQAESAKPRPVKKKRNKALIHLIEWTYIAAMAAAALYLMLVVTEWCLS